MSEVEAGARFLELVGAGDVAGVMEMLETQPDLISARTASRPSLSALIVAVRGGATCSPEMVDLLMKSGAQFPERTLYDACAWSVEPEVFASLARWELRRLPPAMQFRATATSDDDDDDGSTAALMAVGGRSEINVRLVSFLLDWDEETEPSASEGRRALLRLGVLAEAAANPIEVEGERVQEELLALPKMRRALAFVERSVSGEVEPLHPDTVRCVCEIRHIIAEASVQGWSDVVLGMEAQAPAVAREATFVCLRGGQLRAEEAIGAVGKRFLGDVRWTSVRSLFLVRRRLQERQACDSHPLGVLSEPLFRLVAGFCRGGLDVPQLLKQFSLDQPCWCREESYHCGCHDLHLEQALEYSGTIWQ